LKEVREKLDAFAAQFDCRVCWNIESFVRVLAKSKYTGGQPAKKEHTLVLKSLDEEIDHRHSRISGELSKLFQVSRAE
jgi:hypothetical protein